MEFAEFLDFIVKIGVDLGILVGIVGFSEMARRSFTFLQKSKAFVYFLPAFFSAAITWALVDPFTFNNYTTLTFKYAGIAMIMYNLCKNAAFYKKIFPDPDVKSSEVPETTPADKTEGGTP